MSNYIDREAACRTIIGLEMRDCTGCWRYERGIGDDYCFNEALLAASGAISELPAADVVEVVRCEDCRHSYLEPYAAGIAHRICAYGMGADCEVKDDFYCAFGVKTDESEGEEDV